MGFPFAYGTQKKDRLWQLCGDYRRLTLVTPPDKYPFPNMQDLSNGLHGCTVLSNIKSCQGLSPNPCSDGGHPKNCDHYAIWLVLIFVHTFWAAQHRVDFPKNDGPNHRWSGRCVCIHGRLMSWFSGQANTPLPSGGLFYCFSHQWSRR